MSNHGPKVQAILSAVQGRGHNPLYLGYFECFNAQLFFEAHEVLEELWLPQRHEAAGDYYRGLIQLAGAFVHLQRGRTRPAGSLLKLARTNLQKYPGERDGLDVSEVLAIIEDWQGRLEATDYQVNPLSEKSTPRLRPPNPGGMRGDVIEREA
jgi:predicted metal-dependent hydrolase